MPHKILSVVAEQYFECDMLRDLEPFSRRHRSEIATCRQLFVSCLPDGLAGVQFPHSFPMRASSSCVWPASPPAPADVLAKRQHAISKPHHISRIASPQLLSNPDKRCGRTESCSAQAARRGRRLPVFPFIWRNPCFPAFAMQMPIGLSADAYASHC